MYVSPKGMFAFLNRTMAAALPPGTPFKLPEFGPTPPVAIAVTTARDEVETHLVIPAEVVKEIGRLIGTLKPVNSPPPPVEDAPAVEERSEK